MWDWLDAFSNSLGDAAASIIAALQFLYALLVAVAQFLYSLLVAVFNFLVNILKKVAAFLHTLWDSFFKKIFTDIINAIRKLHAWLELHLGPFIKWLQQARAFLDRIFRLYIKPILNLIQHVRQYLQILRLLGVKWAGALDARLGQIEGAIAGIFLRIQGYLNAVIGIVNSLSDPLGLFRRPTFVMSMRRIFPSFMRGVSGMPLGYFFPSPRSNAGNGLGPTQFPLNLTNTTQNPLPSGYLGGDDGLGNFGGWDGVDPLADTSMDGMTVLDYFNDDLYPEPVCSDPVSCAEQALRNALISPLVQS
ncbi:MAG TPA: hypothetical protein VNZ03_14860 [Terriglobales bacterium]|jgi:hypothetical protein|nr:hypothetical protein [Terriglobales bacterium]